MRVRASLALLGAAAVLAGCGSPSVSPAQQVVATPGEPSPSTAPSYPPDIDSAAAYLMDSRGWTAEHAIHVNDVAAGFNRITNASIAAVVGTSFAGAYLDEDTLAPVVASTEPSEDVRHRIVASSLFDAPSAAGVAEDLVVRQVTYDQHELAVLRATYRRLCLEANAGATHFVETGTAPDRNRITLVYDASSPLNDAQRRVVEMAQEDVRIIVDPDRRFDDIPF